ncbi:Phosphotransferase enzyme [Aspergillus hancockii]|nr:Phosphotransferase enzyme [Aspergillus hancockii]
MPGPVPLFLQARHPKLIRYNGEILLKLPEDYKTTKDKNERRQVREHKGKSLVLWAYDTNVEKKNPLRHEIFCQTHGLTKSDAVLFSTNTWDDDVGILLFRECLIRLTRDREETHNRVPCPIAFTEEEQKIHRQEGEGWNNQADLWDMMKGIAQRDGWASNETCQQTLQVFSDAREKVLRGLTGEERSDFEKDTRWAVKGTSA